MFQYYYMYTPGLIFTLVTLAILSSSLPPSVDALRSRLSSLPPRLEGAQSAASEAQAVVVIETNLKELEVWLLSCGKFADNQQILMQIEDHKVTRVIPV